MTTKLFSEAISEVGDKYYEEAENYHCKKHGWVKWSAMAACLYRCTFYRPFQFSPTISVSKVLHHQTIRTE